MTTPHHSERSAAQEPSREQRLAKLIAECSDDPLDYYVEWVWLLNDHARLEAALREIVNVLGPEPCNCGCDGCEIEMAEALGYAQAALNGESA